jgi:2-dehydropantoate 2-reductase
LKILVYGAGPLGSLFAGRLHEAGHAVSLLARGQRLDDLRAYGLVLVDTQTGERTAPPVQVVERLDPDDAYDLVLVIMRKNKALEILPVLAANLHTPDILFLMNNAAGPDELVSALGGERVMIGFPMAAGYRRGHVVHYLVGARAGERALIPIGEVDGSITPRTEAVGRVLTSMPGFGADLRSDMDAWLKTHVALLMPSLGPALYAAGTDNLRLARTRDLVVLAVRAIHEGFGVLRALGIPITPASIRKFAWIPEPLLVWGLQQRLVNPLMRIALVEHAEAAHDEVQHLADEFRALARRTSVPTPAIDQLYAYFDPATSRMPEGRAEIPLDWRGVWLGLSALAGILGIFWVVLKYVETFGGRISKANE